MEMLTLKEAAERLGVMRYNIMYLMETGAITASKVEPFEGQFWHEKTEVLFTAEALEEARAEFERRKFLHVFEQFGYVVEPDAKFAFGPGWEQILRNALTKLTAIPGPPKVTGGKEKFGAMVLHIDHDWTHKDEIKAIRDAYKLFSTETCEECGRPGHLRKGPHLWKTTCEKHAHLVGELPDSGQF
jgi:hypothetical protein